MGNEKTLSETLGEWRAERKHDETQREYWRTRQRVSREKRKPKSPPIQIPAPAPFVPFNPVIMKAGVSINIDFDELAKFPETHIHTILDGVGKVIAASHAIGQKDGER